MHNGLMFLEHEKVPKIGKPELIRDINNGVRPEWLKVMIAAIPLKWFAAYIAEHRYRFFNISELTI